MAQQRHFDRVRGLVSGYTGVPEAEITLETRLVEDIGLDGDTGHEFLESFADEFGVDMSRMDPFNYFDDEPPLYWFSSAIPILALLSPAFRRYVRHATRGRRAVTVRSLVASARAGVWKRPEQGRTDIDPPRLTGRTAIAAAMLAGFFVALTGASYHLFLLIGAQEAWGLAVVLAILWGLLALKIAMALHWLRRLGQAAAFEEQALNAAG
jgi:hypothetical protein